MNELQQPTPSQVHASAGGSSVNLVYTDRKVTFYALSEMDIATITTLSKNVTAYLSLSSFLFSVCFGIYVSAAFTDKVTPAGVLARDLAAPLIGIVAFFFLVMGVADSRSRSIAWADIKKNSTLR